EQNPEQCKGKPLPQKAYTDVKLLQLLLPYGYRENPLASCENAPKEITLTLLKHGLPLPQNALDFAVLAEWWDIIPLYLKHGTAPTALLLEYAIKRDKTEIIETILSQKVIPFSGETLVSALRDNKKLVQRLLDLDAPIDQHVWRYAIPFC